MPKVNSGRIAEAQRQRQNISKKAEKYAPSTVYLQVLGSGARGAPNTLYLFTDQKRYMFNCGECTQRLAHEHKVKLSRLEHIFITSKTWKNIGGLPGLSLTLQDVGVPNITLHGPDGLDELYNATKRFVIMKDMNVTMAKCTGAEDFEDNVMTVKYVLLESQNNFFRTNPIAKKPKLSDVTEKEYQEFIHDDTDYYKWDSNAIEKNAKNAKPRLKFPDKEMIKKKTEKALHDLQDNSAPATVAYICTLKKRFGTLDLDKCVEFGVKAGPMLGQLKSGHDVVLADGTLVKSKDVKTPDDPGPVFIVIEVTDLSVPLESDFAAHFDNGANPPENIPALVVHYTPPHIFHHPTYRSFMSMFGPTTKHLVLNSQNSCLGSEAVHRTQHKLHLLDPDIFPLLKDVSVPAVWNAHPPTPKNDSPIRLKGLEELKDKIAVAQFQSIIHMGGSCKGDGNTICQGEESAGKLDLMVGRTLTQFHLRPRKEIERSLEPKLHIQDYIQETMDVDGFVPSLEQFRRLVERMRYERSDSQKEFPKVVFLGTGSCIPSKTRNTSAIVLQVDETRSMLLDCGEGTFGQLVRFYGPKRVNSFLRTLKVIYISHLHADHHIGLIGVLQARRHAFEEASQKASPVWLLAPGQIVTWLSIYDQLFEKLRDDFTLIPNQNLLEDRMGETSTQKDLTAAVLSKIGVQKITTCLVTHCPNAFGIAIQVDQTHKLTYSGDTIPCEELVKIGRNSTLLIHEATMEDELSEEARVKMHSTTSQAIEIGKQMKAGYTVLTHFSQRYARLPRLNAHILHDNTSVGIAFDNMQITMSDLELLPHMYAPLQLMFADHCVELELKAAHRAKQKERKQIARQPSPTSDPNKRSRSPSCQRAESPSTRGNTRHKDSHISRFKHETISNEVFIGKEPVSPRSKSNSTGKNSSRKSSSCSVPHTPERPSSEKNRSSKKRSDSQSPVGAPATPKDSLHISSDAGEKKQVQEKCKPTRTSSDRHSNTLNSDHAFVSQMKELRSSNDVKSPFSSKKPIVMNVPTIPAASGNESVYVKPLASPVDKKLTIRRRARPLSCSQVEKQPFSLNRSRSPLCSWKAQNSQSPTAVSPNKRENYKPRLANKTATRSSDRIPGLSSNANVKQQTNMTVKSLPTSKQIKPPTPQRRNASIHRVPSRKRLKESEHVPDASAPSGSMMTDDMAFATVPKYRKLNSPIHRECAREPDASPPSAMTADDLAFATVPKYRKLNSPIPRDTINITSNKNQNNTGYNRRAKVTPEVSPTRLPRKCSDFSGKGNMKKSTKENLKPVKEIAKPTVSSNVIVNQQKKQFQNSKAAPTSIKLNHTSNKNYKPQLEDIQSSLLLVQNSIDRNVNPTIKPSCKYSLLKNAINEEQRKIQLEEVKRKYYSKKYWNDSKYDKIEGLNWISWK